MGRFYAEMVGFLEFDGFHLRVMRRWSLEHSGDPVHISNRKARALISFLALDRADHQARQRLCDLLWPNGEEDKARASLRQCLVAIRTAAHSTGQDLITASTEHVSLEKANLTTDLGGLFEALDQGDITEQILLACEDVTSLFADLVQVSDRFAHWVLALRETAISKVSAALRKVFQDDAQDDDLRRRCADASLSVDAFNEDAVRTLMSLYVKNNNPSAALRVYGRFFEFLETELDAEPSRATQDLAVSIKLAGSTSETAPAEPVHAVPQSPAESSAVTLAVLPFEVHSTTDDTEFLAVGLMDHLTCHLASFKSPSVISSNTTRKYIGAVPRPAQVGRELNTRYILSGTVRMDPKDAFLTAQLVEAATERVVWATTQNCASLDLKKLNLPIAEDIARAIVPSVDAEELRKSRTIPLKDLEPYHLMLQAKELVFRLVYEDFVKAGALLRRAAEIGPEFAPAHAMLADWHSINIWEGWSDNPVTDRVALDDHVRKAIALSPRDGRVMALWAHNRMMFNREYDVALSLIQDAIEYCPNDAETLVWSVPTLANTGQSKAATQNARKALSLSPYDPFVFRNEHFLGLALYVNGDYDQSAEYGLSCFRRAPNYRSNIRTTIVSLVAAGRKNEASALVEHHNQITPDFSVAEFQKISGLQNPVDRATYASHLRTAGLPA